MVGTCIRSQCNKYGYERSCSEREISAAVELRNTDTKRDGSKLQKEIWKLPFPSPQFIYVDKTLDGF